MLKYESMKTNGRQIPSFFHVLIVAAFCFFFPLTSFAEEAASSNAAELQADAPQPNTQTQNVLISGYDSNKTAVAAVDKSINLFSSRIKKHFSIWLQRSGQYMEIMQGVLRRKNLPEDMVFLSLIESGFNPNAYSIARAVGPWQFIASTAKRYGLEINWWKDERKDPVKSTEAAAEYLTDLYGMFGSWNLAMAAYNAGEGKIMKAMKKSRADDYWDLLGTKHIKRETKEYVPHFIAASLIATKPEEFGFEDIEYHDPLKFDEVGLAGPLDLTVAAECANTTVEEIRMLNPELRRWCTPPDVMNYVLRIPPGTKETFISNLAAVPEAERFTIEKYLVRKGDTIKSVAQKKGVPVQAVLTLNEMDRSLPLRPGSELLLPPKGLYTMDRDDKAPIRKASLKKKKKKVAQKKTTIAKGASKSNDKPS